MKKHRTSRIWAAALTAVLLAGSVCTVYAVETDYSGELDPMTNLPIGNSSALTGEDGSRALVSSGVYYDWNEHCFVYPVSGTLTEVYCDVMDGMVQGESVSVSATDGSSLLVMCDGEEVTGDLTNLNTPGSYLVSLREGSSTRRMLGFTLVGSRTNSIHTLQAPDGFFVSSATRDGENVYSGRYSVDMEQEGEYSVTLNCMATGLSYTLDTTVDRTPPELTFKGKMDENNRMRSALFFSGLEEGDTIVLVSNGEEVRPELNGDGTGAIYDPGNYVMKVYDYAGNSTEYRFTILIYFNASSWAFIALVLLIVAVIIGYLIFQRRRLKIG